ncbi:MAG: peptide deformylase [Caldilineaceae bacterium]|nr:peptide deformylase [Caldilineaceae bacterium]MCB0090070.1 peptide deformylase [Caldilineaceae bacterium]MCB0142004.1 peptide deformylase [Caldilineaceae bacterium]MCB9148781.1 peptide deformylase [Caldilineaceae bacterium]
MPLLDIVKINTPKEDILYKPTQQVRIFGPALHMLLNNMLETMRASQGVGLAAPQVGISQRITVIEYPDDEEDPENTMRVYELINPKILKARGAEVEQEGCLSIPGLAADVRRSTQVTVRAQDRNGNEFRLKAYDWLARVIQHEVDHLDGKLMLEKAEQVYKLVENEEGEIEAVPIEMSLKQGVR